jgi:predicted dienelactone hydrolase
VWLGGNSNFEDWSEIAPYVFDGFTALATLLNDTRPELGVQVDKWLSYVLEHASNDGWLGPNLNTNDDMLYWIRWPAMKAMLCVRRRREAGGRCGAAGHSEAIVTNSAAPVVPAPPPSAPAASGWSSAATRACCRRS